MLESMDYPEDLSIGTSLTNAETKFNEKMIEDARLEKEKHALEVARLKEELEVKAQMELTAEAETSKYIATM